MLTRLKVQRSLEFSTFVLLEGVGGEANGACEVITAVGNVRLDVRLVWRRLFFCIVLYFLFYFLQ